jgi:O-antigen/teichoic acid export membrane protein
MTSTVKKIAVNTTYQVIGKIFSMTITILTTIVIARYYGRLAYGEFSVMQSWPALFFIIVDFGLNAVAVRELSKKWDNAYKIFNTILTTRILFSLVLMVIVAIVSSVFFPYTKMLKIGLALSLSLILTQALYTSGNIIFQTKLRYDYSTLCYLSGYVVIICLVVASVVIDLNIVFISLSYVVGGSVNYFLSVIYIKKLGVTPRLMIDRETLVYLLKQSLPLGLMFVFSQINFKSDSVLMSILPQPAVLHFSNIDAVALYSLPYKIFEVSLVVPTFFMNSTYPVLVHHLTESKEKLLKTFKKVLLSLAGISVITTICGYIFAPLIISILGGNNFGPSILVLRILFSGLGIYFLTQPLSWLIVTLEKQKYLPYIYLSSALFNVSANLIFIPRYSFYASAIITHISEFIILVLLIITARKVWKSQYA